MQFGRRRSGGSSHAKRMVTSTHNLRPSRRCSSDRCAKKRGRKEEREREIQSSRETATSTCLDIRNSTANPQGRTDRKNAATEPAHQATKRSIGVHSNVTETRVIQSVVTYPVTSLETGTIIDRRSDSTRCPCLALSFSLCLSLSLSLSLCLLLERKGRIIRERERE